MRSSLALLFALMVGAASPAWAVSCDSSVSAQPGRTGYAPRRGDDRCEGLFISPVGAPPVEIVSFTRGELGFDTTKVDRLIVSLAADDSAGSVHVRAVGVPVSIFYRMDADLVPGQTLTWPLGDVVKPRKLRRDQLGIFAFSRTGSSGIVYMPVSIMPAVMAPQTADTVRVVLRSSVDLNKPEWRFMPTGQSDTSFVKLPHKDDEFFASIPAPQHGGGTLELRWRNNMEVSQTRQFDIAF